MAEDPRAHPPAIERAEAIRCLREAEHLYRLADSVQSRRPRGSVDSAILLHRSLLSLVRLMLRLNGDPVPGGSSELVARAREIVAMERLRTDDLIVDFDIIERMREHLRTAEGEVSPEDERRYDRAFTASRDWFEAVEVYLERRLPPGARRWYRHLLPVLALVLVFAGGLFAGTRLRTGPSDERATSVSPPPSASTPAPAPAPAPVAPGSFRATFYHGKDLERPAYSRPDDRIAIDWGNEGPGDPVDDDNWSVRWTGTLHVPDSGEYTFHLTSDDGSRLFLDNALAVDNWSEHGSVTVSETILLSGGDHELRVEFFDDVGTALVRLEWNEAGAPPRLITGTDLR